MSRCFFDKIIPIWTGYSHSHSFHSPSDLFREEDKMVLYSFWRWSLKHVLKWRWFDKWKLIITQEIFTWDRSVNEKWILYAPTLVASFIHRLLFCTKHLESPREKVGPNDEYSKNFKRTGARESWSVRASWTPTLSWGEWKRF